MSKKNSMSIKGKARLFQGDCLDVMKHIPDKKVDMVLCDLPYGTTACPWDVIIPFDKLWEQYGRIVKQNGAILLFSAQPFTTEVINSNRRKYKYNLYWIKNNATGGIFAKTQPMRKLEEICVFYDKLPTYNLVGATKLKKAIVHRVAQTQKVYKQKKNDSVQDTTGYPSNVLYFDGVTSRVHPTQKPVELLEYLIKMYTNEGDTVLDNCMGSGSTGVACINTARKFIGIEQDDHYYKVACGRITQQAKYSDDYGEW